jgi:MOSC domain
MIDFVAAKKVHGRVGGVFVAAGTGFVSAPVEELVLTYEGIPGDRHAGLTRKSNAREPWYPRGTQMRNEQQVSILAEDELAAVAAELNIDELKPEWIGGNIVLSDIAFLSLLPPRTLLMFAGGVTIRVDGGRGPCRHSGRSIAENVTGREDLELAFPKLAKHRRGLVGWVEIPGTIKSGENVTARIWEQCIYPG